jgi:type I restriction enzyme S subunit
MLETWTTHSLGDVVRFASGQVDPKHVDVKERLNVGPENLISGGGIDRLSLRTADQLGLISGKYAFDQKAILYSKIRPNLNKVGLPDFSGVCSADVYPVWVKDPKQLDRSFLYCLLTDTAFALQATTKSFRTGIPKINRPDLAAIPILVPPLAEQRKIAEVLGAWDEAIETSTAVLDAKSRLYLMLVEALIFDGHGEREERTSRRLGDVTRELTARNTSAGLGISEVMGVSNSRGIVPMRFQTIGSDLARYKILPPQGFAYNPMRLSVGSIAMSNLQGNVLVSPDYVLFECIDGELDADFFDHLRRTHWWSHHVDVGGSGSVRVRTYYKELAALHIKLPTFAEQRAIATALNSAQGEIALLKASLTALRQQKRGLMQKLLTGQWRVNVGEAE